MSTLRTNFIAHSFFLLAALVPAAGPVLGQSMDCAIEHVTVINPGSERPQLDRTIVVSGHTITAVVPSKDFKPTTSLRLVDAQGKFVIPGLWDMHMHFRDPGRDLKMDAGNGVLGLQRYGRRRQRGVSVAGCDRPRETNRAKICGLRADCRWP